MSIELWNILHDGSITAAAWTGADELTLTVEIAYLREMFAEPGDGLTIVLHDCDDFAYCGYAADIWQTDLDQIAALGPELLSANAADAGILITCVEGELRLRYERADVALDTDTPITVTQLLDASQRYADTFRKR